MCVHLTDIFWAVVLTEGQRQSISVWTSGTKGWTQFTGFVVIPMPILTWVRCSVQFVFGESARYSTSNMTCISSTTLFPLSCYTQRSLGQTYAPNSTVAMSSKLNKTGALSFLDHIKSQFEDEPSRYQDFLNLMKDYKLSRFVAFFFFALILALILLQNQ